jgi:Tfp pilus assembly protein PilO
VTKLDKKRRTFTVLLGILLAVDVGLAAYLIWPGGSSASTRSEVQKLRQDYLLKFKQTAPLIGMDKKLDLTRVDIKKFDAERTAAHWSQISNEVHKLAHEHGVSLQDIHYKPEDSGIPGIQQVEIDTGIAGDYVKIARFINALERDKLLFVINTIALRGQTSQQGQPGGGVELQISFQTFLRETA